MPDENATPSTLPDRKKPGLMYRINNSILLSVTSIGAVWGLLVAVLNVVEANTEKELAEKQKRDTLVAEMSLEMSRLRYNCAESFGAINSIPDSTSISDLTKTQANHCYQAYQGIVSKIYITGLMLEKPESVGDQEWSDSWESLHARVRSASGYPYEELIIECSWRDILVHLQYDLPGFTQDSCDS